MEFLNTFEVNDTNYSDLAATIESAALTNLVIKLDDISLIEDVSGGKFDGRTKLVLRGDFLHPVYVTAVFADVVTAIDGATGAEVVAIV